LSYLRLTPSDYRAISRVCTRLSLERCTRPAFRRSLIAALGEALSPLAQKVAGFTRAEFRVLYDHFRARDEDPLRGKVSALSHEEWVAFSEACVTYPLPVRFVRPFRHMLVDLFRDVSPELSRKLDRLSARQFEQLYGEATEHKRGSA
jgi:hypothetical protein